MNQENITRQNLGRSLDDLANLDPRGYGVCKILYDGAAAYQGEPLSMNAAKKLCDTLHEGDTVFIISGFVLPPYKMAETDGIISSVTLCRCLTKAFGVRPVLICQDENIPAVKALASVMGLHLFSSIEETEGIPVSMAAIPFTKDSNEAPAMADRLIASSLPAAVISIEAPGANDRGEYHNAVGINTTELEAKSDVLWKKLLERGVLNIAIGDLGNEIGMGAIGEHIKKWIPYTADGQCKCGCGGGIGAATVTDNIITATVSDWGCSAMMAAIAYLRGDINIFHDAAIQKRAMIRASERGAIDMYGWAIPAIDGFGLEINCAIITAMRECVANTLSLKETCRHWFDGVRDKGFFKD